MIFHSDTNVPMQLQSSIVLFEHLNSTLWNGFTINPVGPVSPSFSLNALNALDVLTWAATTDRTVVDFEGLVKTIPMDVPAIGGQRVVENLVTGLVTETITVEAGHEYQVAIEGDSGATATCSGAFTGTLTAIGAGSYISWNSGVPKTAGTTSLTITVTGTLTKLQLEDVTGQANQNPSEFAPAYEEDLGVIIEYGVAYFSTENGNTVDATGVVTEVAGVGITTDGWISGEPARTNYIPDSSDLTATSWIKSGVTFTDIELRQTASTSRHYAYVSLGGTPITGTRVTISALVDKGTSGSDWMSLYGYDTSTAVAYFNLGTGTVGSVLGLNNPSAKITLFKAGTPNKYKVELTYDIGAANYCGIYTVNNDGDEIVAGNVNNYVNIYHVQQEIGESATAPILTVGSATARDEAVVSLDSSVWSNTADTIVMDVETNGIFYDAISADISSIFIGNKYPNVNQGLLRVRTSIGRLQYNDDTADRWHDFSNNMPATGRIKLILRYSGAEAQFGVKKPDNSFIWSPLLSFDGDFSDAFGLLYLMYNIAQSYKLYQIDFYGQDLTVAQIEGIV